MKHFLKYFILLLFLSVSFLSSKILAHEETTFFLSPSSGEYQVNDTFSIELEINSIIGITSLKSYLNFDSSVISVSSIDTTDSVFSTWWENTFDNQEGKVQLQASTPFPGYTGSNGLIARISFRVVDSGTANINYDSSSLALKPDDENILDLTNSLGASFTIPSLESTTESKTILTITFGVLLALIILFVIFKKRLIKVKS